MLIVFALSGACAGSGPQAPGTRERARTGAASLPNARGDASAPEREPQPSAAGHGCPLQVSVATRSYGTGDESQDDYAPRNVGAIWISARERGFVRTIALWGPGYFEYAETWLRESQGSRVDITTMPTRATHARDVAAEWDCRDAQGELVAAGNYQLNVEFTEAEMQGPLLSGDAGIDFELGDAAGEVAREQEGFFGAIRITPSPP